MNLKTISSSSLGILPICCGLIALTGCATALHVPSIQVPTLQLVQPSSQADLDALPKASPDASIVIQLESNIPKTTYFVDGRELVTGKRVKVLVNNQGHEIIARPEGYIEKEQYIQPPYGRADNNTPRLSFYFLMEDKDPNFNPGFASKPTNSQGHSGKPTKPSSKPSSSPTSVASKPAIKPGKVSSIKPKQTASQKRVALVIGNAAYASNPLGNPVNDANAVSDMLTAQGFNVYKLLDGTQKQMDEAVRRFSEELAKSSAVGLFYFAGHGVQVGGVNYLLPVDHTIQTEDDVKYASLNVSAVLDKMGSARNGLNILILDACRDNPLPKSWSRSGTRGLGRIDNSPQGTFIAFATSPGDVAQDGSDGNGLFTKHLIAAMKAPDRELELVFKDVLKAVRDESNNRQIPWTSSSFYGDFRFQEGK